MRIPIHLVGMHETRNLSPIRTLGHGDDPGIAIYSGSRCYLDLELPNGKVLSIDVPLETLNEICQASKEHLAREEDLSKRQPETRFERLLRDD